MSYEIVLRFLATAMLLSFTLGLGGMLYDAMSDGVSDRTAKAITIAYLWPVGILGVVVFASIIAAIY